MPKFKLSVVWHSIRTTVTVVHWYPLLWTGLRIPSNSVVAWLVILDRIQTREKMVSWGLTVDINCLLRDAGIDSRSHLFFGCSFTQEVMRLLTVTNKCRYCSKGSLSLCFYSDLEDTIKAKKVVLGFSN
ncbi:hypothetical protein LINGRAHAP2_LOCUS22302 [Linum grandiflorum]